MTIAYECETRVGGRPMSENQTFEAALERLQTLVKKMESGQMPLEESLQAFEEGVRLSRFCQQHLAAAEQKVELLSRVGSDGKPELQAFTK